MKQHRKQVLLGSIILVLIFSLFSTVTVFADDAAPPPAVTEEPTQPPAATDKPVNTQEPVVIEVDTPSEILDTVPEGVDVVVLNESGESLPLVTEEAAQIIVAGDPMWCPDGATPNNDPANQCTIAHPSFSALINDLESNPGTYAGSGTIYVAYDYNATTAGDAGNNIVFDYGAVELTDLVVQGGWNFATGSVFGTSTIDLGTGNSLEFLDWGGYGVSGSITLNNIIVTNSGDLYIGDDSDITTANVTLNNVDVNNTDNGTYIETDGSVTVNNSSFSDNGAGESTARGLTVYAISDINLTNVIASGNAGGGADLNNESGYGNITLTGVNTFDNNGFNLSPSVGLYAVSNGNITLNGVSASGNGLGFGGGAFIGSGGSISITNSNFDNNCTNCEAGLGVVAFADGEVTLNSVTANGNGNDPINGYTDPAIGLGAMIFSNDNVFVNNSDFSGNCALGDCLGAGIEVVASIGSVYFYDVTASGNGVGAFIEAYGGNVEIYCSTFSNNATYGLVVGVPSGSTLTLGNIVFGGNSAGDLDFSGSAGTLVENVFNCAKKKAPTFSLPINIVNTTSGQSTDLDCDLYGGTKLILPNGDSLYLPCPIGDTASLAVQTSDGLPSPLPDGNTFQSAFTTEVRKDGESQGDLSAYATISFAIPEGVDVSTLSILFWDGAQWVDLVGVSVTGDGHLEAFVNYTGTFVLVQK